MDTDEWPALWHYQTPGPGREGSLSCQHILQGQSGGYRHRTMDHDPQQRHAAHCQGEDLSGNET